MAETSLPGMTRRLAAGALELLYPRRCVGCGQFGTHVCDECLGRLELTADGQRCPNCDARWESGGNCPRCFGWTALDGGRAAVEMGGVARGIIHGLKYRRIEGLAGVIAAQIAGLRERAPFDAAVPIPLHRSRVRQRGFNQAALILQATGWPMLDGRLERTRKTRTQVGLRARERRTNVGGAFGYTGPALTGIRIALVDDVVTTGSTADECAAVLRDAGALSVLVISFARASYSTAADVPIDQ